MDDYQQQNDSYDLYENLIDYRDINIQDDMRNECKIQDNQDKIQYQDVYDTSKLSNVDDNNDYLNQIKMQTKLNDVTKMKQQPFISSIVKSTLYGYLKKGGYRHITDYQETLSCLLLRAYCKKHKKDMILHIIRSTRDDYELMRQRHESIIAIDTLQFIQKYYSIIFYQDIYLTVIVQDVYSTTLQEEINQKKKKNSSLNLFSEHQKNTLIFQMTHALTEIHSYQLIHYNINPNNIIKSEEGIYKLAHFNEILTLKNRLTASIQDCYLKYYSPECLAYLSDRKKSLDYLSHKIDAYSISMIILDIMKACVDYNNQSKQASNKPFIQLIQQEEKQERQSEIMQQKSIQQYPQYIHDLELNLLNRDQQNRKNSFELLNVLHPYLNLQQSNLQSMLQSINRSLKQDVFSLNKAQSYLKCLRLHYSLLRLQLLLQMSNKIISDEHKSDQHKLCASPQKLSEQTQQDQINLSLAPQNQSAQQIISGRLKCNLINKQQYPVILSDGYKCAAINLIANREYSKGLEYSLSSVNILRTHCTHNKRDIINTLIIISISYYKLKQFQLALDYSLESFQLSQSLSPLDRSISHLDQSLSPLDKSLSPLDKSINPLDQALLAKSASRLSWCYFRLQLADQTLQYAQLSLLLYRQLNNKKYNLCIADAYDAIGNANQMIGQSQISLDNFKKSLLIRINNLHSTNPIIALSYFNIASVNEKQFTFQDAFDSYIKSANIYEQHHNRYKQLLLTSLKKAIYCLNQLNKQAEAQSIQSKIDQINAQTPQ